MSKADDKFYAEVIEIETEYNRIANILRNQEEETSSIWIALGELRGLTQFRKEISNSSIREAMQWHKDNLAQWREDI